MVASLREQLADRIGVTEELSPRGGNPALDALRQQLQGLAPEVLAGDEKASAEAARIEAAIADEERRVRLADLAAVEQAARDRAAAEAEAERERQEAADAKATAESERAVEMAKADGHLRKLTAALHRIRDLDYEVSVQGSKAESKPGYSFPRAFSAIESLISWDLRSVGIDGLPYVSGQRPEIAGLFKVKAKAKKPAPDTAES